MKIIKRIIIVDEIPENCSECCNLESCFLPGNDKIKKAYLAKRHKDCPLILANELKKIIELHN